MEVSSTSSNATSSSLPNDSDENDDRHDAAESTDELNTLSVTNEDNNAKEKACSAAGDSGSVAVVPYGPIVGPHFYPSDSVGYSKDVRDSKAVHGSSGLYNLGNTCYMNAGLQSLFSCAPIIKHFSEKYSFSDGNRHTLTYHFYVLLCKIWSGQFLVIHPRTFKDFLGLYHSQFEDYRQHDCQEFLAFLLDTLHEQLNLSIPSNNLFRQSSSHSSPDRNESSKATDPSSVSSRPSTSASSPEVGKGEEFPASEGMSCEKAGGLVESTKDKEESAVVSTASCSPQSLDEEAASELNRDSDLAEKPSCDCISSSCPTLRRYTSRSNLDDVSSSDMSLAVKPSLKRVSSDSGVTASGLVFLSEDSNQSSISVHSTDSEQSSAFKRLKIESLEANKNSNSNNYSQKDFVSSTSDCKAEITGVRDERVVGSMMKCNEAVASTSGNVNALLLTTNLEKNVNIGASNSLSSDVTLESLKEISEGDKDLEDFYRKETKTLNTNVLVSDNTHEISCDSEKFAKMDNRNRPLSKEINLLQEAFGEEDKVDKVLISQHFGLKGTNILTQASSSVVKPSNSVKVLNNSCEEEAMTYSPLAKISSETTSDEVMEEKALSPLKNVADGDLMTKLDEVEKNVQMQAYSKFNTTPVRSNIRKDLIDADPAEKPNDVDEVEDDESSDEEVVEKTSHSSSVDNCSSIPNCLRNFSSTEVAMANQAWCDYKARNDSIIVSTFQGQFRSTVVCSECNHVSVTYEPFMYLSLPIPHAMEQQLCVTYISVSKPPVRYLLNLLKTDKIGTAKKKLKEMLCQTDGDVIMAEMLDLHVSRIMDDNILLKYVNTLNRKIYAFEVINAMSVIESSPHELYSDDLLNNGENQHSSGLKGEGPCFGSVASPSRDESGVGLLRRSDSQISNHSFDSITANSPTSRDAMDLGFSDTEMCESSSGQEIGLSSSYFHEERREDDDICQSTSDEPSTSYFSSHSTKVINKAVSSTTTSLSWQSLGMENNRSLKEAASPAVESSSSSPHLEEGEGRTSADVTSSPRLSNFWINQHACSDFPADGAGSSSLLGVPSVSGARDGGDISPRLSESKGDMASKEGRGDLSGGDGCYDRPISAGCVMEIEEDEGGNKSGGSRSCPSPEAYVHHQHAQSDLLAQAAGRLTDNPGSYFLQASQFDSMGPVCQSEISSEMADASCKEEEPPIMDGKTPCVTSDWSEFIPLEDGSSSVDHNPLHCKNADVASTSTQSNAALSGEGGASSRIPLTTDQWRPCAICLEDLPSSQLLTHVSCDGVFCQNCLDMSVKHTANISAYCCPICLHPASIYDDFVQLQSTGDAKCNIRMLPVCITYRHVVVDNTGASSLQLVGHPNIVQLPSVISGEALYATVDRLLTRPVFTYSVMLTDGQGLSCSRCAYSSHCTGCEIAREGDVALHPSDCLTVHSCEMLSPEEVSELQHVYDDVSVEGMRSTEPTTLMDCFRAFTQSELLDEHNPWFCPQCERNQCAKKTMTVWRYPDNLIIHLKRFVYQDLSSTKVDTRVIFPHQAMDLRGFLSGPSSSSLMYNLYSVVCHFGGASSGHYTCFTKHPLTSEWHYYNDETVSPQAPADSEYTNGYVLFYQRQGTEVEFTPPHYSPNMEESVSNDSATTSSMASVSTSAMGPFPSPAKPPPTSSSMALVLFEPVTSSLPWSAPAPPPPPPSTAAAAKKTEPENEEVDDDYDYEQRRCSPFCDYDSLTVHFGADFPEVEEP